MCRHLAYLGAETTLASVLLEPEHSLYRQSWEPRQQRHGTVNADGYGFGWYPGAGDPGSDGEDTCFRHRRAVPIWADANLPDLARAVRSHSFLAAVRSATAGTTQDESAAAPFREGRWLFSHNGAVPDWTRLPTAGSGLDTADLLALEARSDSALLWAMVARRLRQGEPPGLALAGVVRRVAQARPGARLNLLLTDGRTIAATRYGDTLWYRRAEDHVLVASEPHDDDSDWKEVPDHTLLLAAPDAVRSHPLRPVRPHSAQRRPHSKDENVNDCFSIEPRLPSDYFATTLRADVRQGLAAQPKTLPPKWFYDELGSKLFEQITELPEYYPTRAEQEILQKRAPEIAAITRARSLVELGSGSSRKTRLLLDALTALGTLQRYSPLDVSASALTEAGEALCRDYPALRVTAAVTDFEHDLPLHDEPGPRLLAFLGSTIGNLDPAERTDFYALLRRSLSADDVLLLGADLVKDPGVLVAAYDDSQGVTGAFNKNVLHVLNRELDADFDPDAFEHRAVWNAEAERIEMHLLSRTEQRVKIPAVDLSVAFAAGESLRTEISTKFRRESLTVELAAAGFTVRRWWTDRASRFALLLVLPSK
ncbi:dimethylhistidine N-methyltransferase/ergothioneine biosynthesis protein EgtC [Streptacidiphilus sp. EB103A]